MKNISFLNNDTIKIKAEQLYIVIDALYLMDIKENLDKIEKIELIDSIRKICFPYSDIPFAEITTSKSIFAIDNFKKIDNYKDADISNRALLSTDTGLLIFINKEILIRFIGLFDYDNLVNSLTDIINIDYWDVITQQFDETDLGLMLSQSEEEGILCGGGVYRIMND